MGRDRKGAQSCVLYLNLNCDAIGGTLNNIILNKNIFQSQNKKYVKEFIKIEKKKNSDLIELHNRPIYLSYLIVNNLLG